MVSRPTSGLAQFQQSCQTRPEPESHHAAVRHSLKVLQCLVHCREVDWRSLGQDLKFGG